LRKNAGATVPEGGFSRPTDAANLSGFSPGLSLGFFDALQELRSPSDSSAPFTHKIPDGPKCQTGAEADRSSSQRAAEAALGYGCSGILLQALKASSLTADHAFFFATSEAVLFYICSAIFPHALTSLQNPQTIPARRS
jgi:hypothetical protein